MEEYPQLVELHELSKAFTIAKIIYSNNITYITKTLLISPCPCPSKVRMPVNYLMIKQHDQEDCRSPAGFAMHAMVIGSLFLFAT